MTTAILLAVGSPVAAQQAAGIEVDRTQRNGAVAVATRTARIPDEIAFAVVPYARCLSTERDRLQGEGITLFSEPQRVADILATCGTARDEAVFLASTALERGSELEISARRTMIFDTIKIMEDMILETELPQRGDQ